MTILPTKTGAAMRGSLVLEAAIGYGVLLVVALLMLKASRTVAAAQQWTVRQAMTDAYMTRETALGTRWPFDDFKLNGSPWPTYPSIDEETVVVGRMPGGNTVTATIRRTKYPAPENLVTAGGAGTESTNPAQTEAWKLQSLLLFQVGDRDYVKSRTVLRVR